MDISVVGSLVLCAVLVTSAYGFSLALVAGRGRPQLLPASRAATYTTCALVLLAVCVLAYGFQVHDFRIRYIARYSDRSMPWYYLVSSLWGGQDGSLLWWAFLVSGWTALCTRWMYRRYQELQPYVLATLLSIIAFFAVLMLFAANPFATTAASVPLDGEGLNPLLQNYWMMIHPPVLYMGFVGWSVPFAFCIAALVTGRLGEEWILAVRKWSLAAWTFLAVGNLLGGLWSYEELGWGGYWAWDPVENASFMPLLVGTAYLHSVMIQERRGMLKVWNVFLMCLTFIMTIFGTFLTRSGLIASVHSFARSDIGVYFAYYLVLLCAVCLVLIFWRLPRLRSEHTIDSMVSREFAFLAQNWILLGMMVFVLLATTFPLISEALRDETVTLGPAFYNASMIPLGLVLMLLTGVGPLISWRKATGRNLLDAFVKPTAAALVVLLLHVFGGDSVGYPAYVASEPVMDSRVGQIMALINGAAPALSICLCVFVTGTILQEFWRGTAVRMRNAGQGLLGALGELVSRARRRYGGYVVHLGLVFMFVGFTGATYDIEKEAALRPGERMQVGNYALRFDGPRMEADSGKRMVFADMTIFSGSAEVARVSPAKFIYRSHPEMPTTEVAIRSTPANDLYVIMSSVNAQSKLGTFRVVLRPLVMWIWIGGVVMLLGAFISMAPTVAEVLGWLSSPSTSALRRPAFASFWALVFLLAALCVSWWTFAPVASAQSESGSSLMAGTVEMNSPEERLLFGRLLCQCGDCPRLPLSTCGCGWAQQMRVDLRTRLEAGDPVKKIQMDYRESYGAKAIAVPSDKGLDRALWALPLTVLVAAMCLLLVLGRRWVRRSRKIEADPGGAASLPAPPEGAQESLDAQLEEELRRLED